MTSLFAQEFGLPPLGSAAPVGQQRIVLGDVRGYSPEQQELFRIYTP